MTHRMKMLLATVVFLGGCAPTLGSGLGPGSGLPGDLFSAGDAPAAQTSMITSTRAFGPGADIPSTFTATGGLPEERDTETVALTSPALLERGQSAAPRGVLVASGGL